MNLEQMHKQKNAAVSTLVKGVEGLFKKNGVEYLHGLASFDTAKRLSVKGPDGRSFAVEAKNFVLATGSVPLEFPGTPFDEQDIVSSTGALELKRVPKDLVVIGGGIIGLELGSVWSRLGSNVTVVEYTDRIGVGMDASVSSAFQKILQKQGLKFKLGTKVEQISKSKVHCRNEATGATEMIPCDVVLVSIGRRPNTDALNLDAIGVKRDSKKMVITDDRFRTNIGHIYAIGDMINGPMLAHKAEEEGIAVAENIAGGHGFVNYDAIPSVVYTHPEVAWCGKTEEQLKEGGKKYVSGSFPFLANSRAKTNNDTEGFVKILAAEEDGRILGAHVIGPNAGEMISEAVLAIEYGASAEDVARTCHAHPTLSEAFKEACMSVSGIKKPIHM